MAEVIKSEGWEDQPAVTLLRLTGTSGVYVTQASLSAIAYKVFDLNSATPDTATVTSTATIADTVFDTLQTDSIWTVDVTGYNFKHTLAGTCFPTGNRRYRIEYVFTESVGTTFAVVVEHYAKAVRGS